MTTLQQLEQVPCPGYTSPVTGQYYPGTTHHFITRQGARCATCGTPEARVRADLEAGR